MWRYGRLGLVALPPTVARISASFHTSRMSRVLTAAWVLGLAGVAALLRLLVTSNRHSAHFGRWVAVATACFVSCALLAASTGGVGSV